MPEGKICALFQIFYKEHNHLCIESQCGFWSTLVGDCGFIVAAHSLLSIADSLKKIDEHFSYFSPDTR